jgi:hypothetical protein
MFANGNDDGGGGDKNILHLPYCKLVNLLLNLENEFS